MVMHAGHGILEVPENIMAQSPTKAHLQYKHGYKCVRKNKKARACIRENVVCTVYHIHCTVIFMRIRRVVSKTRFLANYLLKFPELFSQL